MKLWPRNAGCRQAPLAPGTRLGNFEIGGILGRGGMGAVYMAVRQNDGQPAAVKVFPRDNTAAGEDARARFEREADALCSLCHPNIANILGHGSCGVIDYIASELVDGASLEQLLRATTLTMRHYRRIITETGRALDHIHSSGIIHCDIKPSNILVSRGGAVKITDFGCARFAPRRRAFSGANEKSWGTAGYMAPEQFDAPEKIGIQTDVYALGVTFYKMFTRRLPGQAGCVPASRVNALVPPAADAVLWRAMKTDQSERYASVSEYCGALIEALDDIAPRSGDAEKYDSAGTRMRARLILILSLAATLAALIVLAALVFKTR
ncbi:MAG: serine/threonine-protein kinase [bacterium]|nr:serine/threonine-protein kinase [Candidatus Sumerlaeota bacterium]